MNPCALLAKQAPAAAGGAAAGDISVGATVLALIALGPPAWTWLPAGSNAAGAGRLPGPAAGALDRQRRAGRLCGLLMLLQYLPLLALHWRGFAATDGGKLPEGSEMTFLRSRRAQRAWRPSCSGRCGWPAPPGPGPSAGLGARRTGPRRSPGMDRLGLHHPPVLAVQAVLTALFPSEHPLISVIKANKALLPVAAVLAVLIAPLAEEFFFRVVVQGWLEKIERGCGSGPRHWLAAGSAAGAGQFAGLCGGPLRQAPTRCRCSSWPWCWATCTGKRTGSGRRSSCT